MKNPTGQQPQRSTPWVFRHLALELAIAEGTSCLRPILSEGKKNPPDFWWFNEKEIDGEKLEIKKHGNIFFWNMMNRKVVGWDMLRHRILIWTSDCHYCGIFLCRDRVSVQRKPGKSVWIFWHALHATFRSNQIASENHVCHGQKSLYWRWSSHL